MPESVTTFSAIALAIFVEAMPFLAVGALLSAAIEEFVPPERLASWLPKGTGAGIALGAAAGMLLPTCECGVVPVARRLMSKGVPPQVAVAYMLAAPVVNPVVLVSTWVAFQGRPSMVAGRMLMAAGIAMLMALIARRMGNILKAACHAVHPPEACCHHGHHAVSAIGAFHAAANRVSLAAKFWTVLKHGGHEFLDMGRFLILGAVAAALFKTFLPQEMILAVTGSPALQIAGMMVLAVLLSICSEADAFVAASFLPFSSASQLAFVTIGPMVDLKLIGMYAVTFKRPFFWTLMVGPALLVFALSMIFGMIP
ncbi:MAG: permease [Desulfosarcina sp.]|jgi:hypothetical protein